MSDFPKYRGELEYKCLGCARTFPVDELHYTCPHCGGVFLLRDKNFHHLQETSGAKWREIFDSRAASKDSQLRGIFRFYELIAPVLESEDVVYLGEANTPIIPASPGLREKVGRNFAYKNDGQNPSASFKDRGMACAFSFLGKLVREKGWEKILTVCASTGDTSASAALYGSYCGEAVKTVVLLPQGKVTPQQLAQPLGSGALVLEVGGVFDDCMKVVEYLADNYRVALLNSKNAWRILGQESYAYEIAQWYDWEVGSKAVFVPIGNAGNITAIMRGFLKLHSLGIIRELPRIFGVQTAHADPVYRYYRQNKGSREYQPVTVRPSVAQAAMIGNPVSFPRVRALVEEYEGIAKEGAFTVLQVSEQEIIEGMLLANRHGHIACTQGGECLAGLIKAAEAELIRPEEEAILDSTAHMLKFIGFQEMYFNDDFPEGYAIQPQKDMVNRPKTLISEAEKKGLSDSEYTRLAGDRVVDMLGLDSL
ncbi:MAG: threonine synthase [Desulfonatronovibrionaceae bacterium]